MSAVFLYSYSSLDKVTLTLTYISFPSVISFSFFSDHHHNQNHHQQQVNQATQQLFLPELAGLIPGLNPGVAALSGLNGLNGAGGVDHAALLAQLNQANLASLVGTPLRTTGLQASSNLGRFGMPSLLPGTTATLPAASAANQNAAFLQNGLQSPTAEAGLLYAAAAGYDPNMLQLGIFSANSPVASQSEIGSAGAGSSESNFGEFCLYPHCLLVWFTKFLKIRKNNYPSQGTIWNMEVKPKSKFIGFKFLCHVLASKDGKLL